MLEKSPPVIVGAIAGSAIALIFFLRMRIEEMAGKAASRQSAFGGFETEDVLYLLPLVTLSNGVVPLLLAASVGAPLFAAWVVLDHQRLLRKQKPEAQSTCRCRISMAHLCDCPADPRGEHAPSDASEVRCREPIVTAAFAEVGQLREVSRGCWAAAALYAACSSDYSSRHLRLALCTLAWGVLPG